MTHSERSQRDLAPRTGLRRWSASAGVLSLLLLWAPLLLGARGCEKVVVGEECEDGMCAGSGESPQAGEGGAGTGDGPEAGAGDSGGSGTSGGGDSGTNGGGDSGTGAAGTGSSGTSGGGDSGTGGDGDADGCEHGGEHYELGDSFPSEDGCNTCSCTEGGVACTLRACAERDCGGIAGLACEAGEYCNYPEDALCGAADATGTCAVIPDACDLIYQPVCGCDDVTYGNACAAAAEGVSVASEGECDDGGGTGQTCGGIASLECPSGDQFCNYEESAGGQGCDGSISDAGGVCQTRPDVCPAIYAPVCGCDRRTYSSDCNAHGAGVSVLRQDACTEIDCEAIGGHAVNGAGPGPMCPQGETDAGPIRYSNGMIAIEGTICCVP